MELSDLFRCLKDQYLVLKEYLDTLLEHQKAIVSGSLEGIEETVKREGALLFNIGSLETKRFEIIQQLAVKYSFEIDSNKLSDFIEKAKEQKLFDTSALTNLKSSLQKLISEIIKVNTQNKFLIEQARSFIKEVVSAFTKSNRNALVDRRY